MSTVIEHGVVVPKPTVKAVAYCTERLKVIILVMNGYTLDSGFTRALSLCDSLTLIQKFSVCRAHRNGYIYVFIGINSSATLPSACIAHAPTLV